MSESHKGKTPSEETRHKMSLAHMGNKYAVGHQSRLGHKHTEESKRKIGASKLGNKNMLGHKHSDEVRRKISEATGTKGICNRCKEQKPESEFAPDRGHICIACGKLYQKEYGELHQEEIAEKKKRYYEIHKQEFREKAERHYRTHKTTISEGQKRYVANHRQQIAERKKQYYEIHKEESARRQKLYYEAHKEECAKKRKNYRKTLEGKEAHKRGKIKYRSLLSSVPATLTAKQWSEILTAHGFCCAYCGRPFSDGLQATQDHVMPVSRGGFHTADNVVPACQPCNSSKGARMIAVGGP